ncbi:MAG: citramalate synthase [Gemmatimonadetes bacterium]|jgi:2-isopropylmalate synthase|nr:citramalate synthase [Gemmatimonadota bacterium]MBT5141700.1 citramalate synthase [Gemmatimonadota bacterium]MBT5591003.1 citramalate synthase [Gemmatimonadota bacterium]MBT5964931.1 citramalate synthase [Gemmatimonadota bacterium]MBT6625586.1 citramalate synthase [Gemmatimonadota bacterium]
MSDRIEIYDSTLRDGAQAEGITYSLEDKLLIARRLDDLGVDYIEGGWPNPTNPKDLAFFERIGGLGLKARVTAFGSTRRATNAPEDDATLGTLLQAQTQSVAVFGKSWDLHVTQVMKTTRESNLELIEDSVGYLVSEGREVIYDAEHFFDGYKADAEYALETLRAAVAGGARILALCDTNGGTLPSELAPIFSAAQKAAGATPLGIHAHNDSGMGAANSVAAVELGASQVQGTFNGYGERCGNANLCTVIPTLELKLGKRTIGKDKVADLMIFSRFLSEIANVAHDHRQPYVGESAYAHKGGVHIDAMTKDPRCYEHADPEATGNGRRFLVSDQSGGGTVVAKLNRFFPDMNKTDPIVAQVLNSVKKLEHEGYQFEAAEGSFELLARRAMGLYENMFTTVSYRIESRKDEPPAKGEAGGQSDMKKAGTEDSQAIVKVEVGGEVLHTVAEGDGPVNAIDRALRKALEGVYPSLASVHLEDYKVRVMSSADGTAARVRVLIESSDGQDVWGTVGVSENVIEASWIALADSLHFKLMREAMAHLTSTQNVAVPAAGGGA